MQPELLADGLTSSSRIQQVSCPVNRLRREFNSQILGMQSSTLSRWYIPGRSSDMSMIKALPALLLLSLVEISACGHAQKTNGSERCLLCEAEARQNEPAQSWKIVIKSEQNVVNSKQIFFVDTTIANAGKQIQILTLPDCGFPHWETDNTFVHLNIASCLMNPIARKDLKAGEVYRMKMPVYVELQPGTIRQDAVTFRMGYANSVPANGETAKLNSQLFWSNSITVTVTR
jgi:hypothetical protein